MTVSLSLRARLSSSAGIFTILLYLLSLTHLVTASNHTGENHGRVDHHDGYRFPRGVLKEFYGLETYFSYPRNIRDPSESKIVVFFPDIQGIKSNESQIWADKLAGHGYFVIMPDIYNGEAIPPPDQQGPDFNLSAWIDSHGAEVLQPTVDLAYAAIMREFNPRRLGTIGICYGAKFSVRLLSDRAHVAFIAHPSFVTPEEYYEIQGPISIAAAEKDDYYTKELRRTSEDILTDIRADYQLFLYGRTEHGFSVRADPQNRVVQFQSESAFEQALRWFDEFL